MHYQWDFAYMLRYVPLFWRGILVTLAYTGGTIALGLVLGLAIGLGRLSKSKLLNFPLIAFIEAFRCTPLLVQIVWFYYALPVIVPMQDGRACVLRAIEQGQAQVLSPETGEQELVMPAAELDAMASGEVLVVRKPAVRADQTLTPLQGAAFEWFWGTLWRFRHFYLESMLATVVANILAAPLTVLAPLLCAHVAPKGHLLLAGILARQADELKQAYAPYCQLDVADAQEGWILMTARCG